MKPKVLVTRKIPGDLFHALREKAEVVIHPEDRAMTAEEIRTQVTDTVALLPMALDSISARILQAGKKLKIVANYGVGFNNIDVAEASRLKIAVTNTPDVLTDTTADLTFALILGAARRVGEGERFLRAGKWKEWKPDTLLGTDVYGKTIGIIGMGRIGMAVARRAVGFAMKILYADVRPVAPEIEKRVQAQFVSLPELLKRSDFVTLHVNLTTQTTHFISKEELSQMKKTAFLINVSRGPVVDEQALVDALQSGTIAGAGLDVFENEPMVSPQLVAMENVLLVPHIGSASLETREKMGQVAVKNIMAILNGEIPPNLVNPEILQM
jgi:glyoxylate reductase